MPPLGPIEKYRPPENDVENFESLHIREYVVAKKIERAMVLAQIDEENFFSRAVSFIVRGKGEILKTPYVYYESTGLDTDEKMAAWIQRRMFTNDQPTLYTQTVMPYSSGYAFMDFAEARASVDPSLENHLKIHDPLADYLPYDMRRTLVEDISSVLDLIITNANRTQA
jgi:hypothetical protein